jgi:Starch-binding associating with outer membrane
MKNISIKKFAAAALITSVIMGTGCAKIDQFGNINQNPNGITTPLPAALLTNALSQVGNITSGVVSGIGYNPRSANYAQYIAENQYTDVSLMALPQSEMGTAYSGPLQDMQTVINYNSNPTTAVAASEFGTNANQIGIAKVVRAYIFWVTTDRWGDIPYSEALQGASNLLPKYDKQEDVYFALIKECKDAAAMFDLTMPKPVKGDIMYNGDVSKWKRLANSLRMLMALRLTNKYPAAGGKAAVEFADAVTAAGGIIDDNAHNATINYPGGGFKNPWYLTYESRDDYASSKTMGDVLAGLGDTRGAAFGTNAIMFPVGLTRDLAIAYGNSVGNGQSRVLRADLRQANSPLVVIPASLVLLARAEAKERLWIAGGTAGAEADYNAGITASYAQWGLTVSPAYFTGAANYNAGAGVPGNVGAGTAPYDNFRAASSNVQDAITANKLARIALQYWIAAFPNGDEGWSSWRRTGVPNLKLTRFSTGPYVLRWVFGANDYALNNANTVAAATAIGGDKQETKVWWDN